MVPVLEKTPNQPLKIKV